MLVSLRGCGEDGSMNVEELQIGTICHSCTCQCEALLLWSGRQEEEVKKKEKIPCPPPFLSPTYTF